MKRILLSLFIIGAFASSVRAACTGADACVQETTPVFVTSGNNPNPIFGTAPTAGHIVMAWVATGGGTATVTISGEGATWVTLYDSGSHASAERDLLFCGIVVTPATSVTFTVSAGNSAAKLAEFQGYNCTAAGTAVTGEATSGTGLTLGAFTTTHATSLIVAGVSHAHAEAVTDNNTGFVQMIGLNSAGVPTINEDYRVSTKTESATLAWTWTSNVGNGGGVAAVQSVNNVMASGEEDTDPYSPAVPSPIPTLPNKGLFEWIGVNSCPSPLDSHMIGCAFTVRWADLEPADGTFEWRPITDREGLYTSANPLQIFVLTGAGGAPTTAIQTAALYRNACPHCIQGTSTGWLGSLVTTIPINWDYVTALYPSCTVLNEPWVGDAVYQTKLKAFIDAFAAQFGSDPKVALIGIPPMSHWGFDVSIAKSVNPKITACQANYNTAWQTATGITDEPTWSSTIQTAFDSLWDYEVAHLGNTLNISLWTEPSQVGAITPANTNDVTLNNALFQHAGQNPPAQIYYCGNESLNDNSGFAGFVDAACTPYVGTHVNIGSQDHGTWNINYNPATPPPNPYSGWCSSAGGPNGSGTPNWVDAYNTWRDRATFGQVYQNTSTLSGNCQADSITCPFNGTTESSVHCVSDMLGGP